MWHFNKRSQVETSERRSMFISQYHEGAEAWPCSCTELRLSIYLILFYFFPPVNRNNVAPFVTLRYNLDWKVMTDSPRLPDTSCYEQENWERSLKKGGVDLCDRIHRKEGGTGAQFHMPEALSHSVSTPLYVTIAGIAWLRKQGHKSQWQQPERLPECRLTISYVTWTLDEEHSNGFTHCSSLEPVLKWKLNFPPWPTSTS